MNTEMETQNLPLSVFALLGYVKGLLERHPYSDKARDAAVLAIDIFLSESTEDVAFIFPIIIKK